jgi:cell division protein FtsL
MPAPQTYATHRRFEPVQHFILFPFFLVTAGATIYTFVRRPTLGTLWVALLALAVLTLALQVRVYALRVQDRLIRLEERLRLAQLLPEDLKARIPELTVKQLVGLRFAADAEVPDRVREALQEQLSGEAIKKRIQTWRPDEFRV